MIDRFCVIFHLFLSVRVFVFVCVFPKKKLPKQKLGEKSCASV